MFRKKIYGKKVYLEDNEYIADIRVNYVNKSKYMLLEHVLSNRVLKITYRYKSCYLIVKVGNLKVNGQWLMGTVIDAYTKPIYNKATKKNNSNTNSNDNTNNNNNSSNSNSNNSNNSTNNSNTSA